MSHKFIKVPKMWEVVLAEKRANASVYRLALYLLDQATWNENVALGNGALEKRGVNRWAKWRALEALRKTGLIAVEHRTGKTPVIKVRFTR
jgi:hypothetical protein